MSHNILAILDRPQTAHSVLAAAALTAKRTGNASIEALHLRHDALEGFLPTEEAMTKQRKLELEGAATRKSAEMHDLFNTWHQQAGTGDWKEVVGETKNVVTAEATDADFVVIGHGAGRYQGDARQAIHAAMFDAKRATIIVPEAIPTSLGRSIAVAWKPSAAADRAIDAAMPLLMRAEQVNILVETDDGDEEAEPVSGLKRLKQAGVPVTMLRFQANGRKIGDALIDEAHNVGADLLVMGAYTHNRFAEFILGGATREVLATADLPVLMHH